MMIDRNHNEQEEKMQLDPSQIPPIPSLSMPLFQIPIISNAPLPSIIKTPNNIQLPIILPPEVPAPLGNTLNKEIITDSSLSENNNNNKRKKNKKKSTKKRKKNKKKSTKKKKHRNESQKKNKSKRRYKKSGEPKQFRVEFVNGGLKLKDGGALFKFLYKDEYGRYFYQCPFKTDCNPVTGTSVHLHAQRCRNLRTFECEQCINILNGNNAKKKKKVRVWKFNTKKDLMQHQQAIHGEKVACDVCGKLFSREDSMKRHQKTVCNKKKKKRKRKKNKKKPITRRNQNEEEEREEDEQEEDEQEEDEQEEEKEVIETRRRGRRRGIIMIRVRKRRKNQNKKEDTPDENRDEEENDNDEAQQNADQDSVDNDDKDIDQKDDEDQDNNDDDDNEDVDQQDNENQYSNDDDNEDVDQQDNENQHNNNDDDNKDVDQQDDQIINSHKKVDEDEYDEDDLHTADKDNQSINSHKKMDEDEYDDDDDMTKKEEKTQIIDKDGEEEDDEEDDDDIDDKKKKLTPKSFTQQKQNKEKEEESDDESIDYEKHSHNKKRTTPRKKLNMPRITTHRYLTRSGGFRNLRRSARLATKRRQATSQSGEIITIDLSDDLPQPFDIIKFRTKISEKYQSAMIMLDNGNGNFTIEWMKHPDLLIKRNINLYECDWEMDISKHKKKKFARLLQNEEWKRKNHNNRNK